MYAYVSSLLKDGVVPFIRLGRQVCGTDLRLEIILLHTYVVMQLHIYIDIACVPQLSGSKVHSEYALNVMYTLECGLKSSEKLLASVIQLHDFIVQYMVCRLCQFYVRLQIAYLHTYSITFQKDSILLFYCCP